jgi:hypothetical protein
VLEAATLAAAIGELAPGEQGRLPSLVVLHEAAQAVYRDGVDADPELDLSPRRRRHGT